MRSFVDQSYSWAERWTRSGYSILALFILVFLDSSFFPFPTTILFITISLFYPRRSNLNALVATAAMGAGGMLGYCIGYYMWLTPGGDFTPLARFFF